MAQVKKLRDFVRRAIRDTAVAKEGPERVELKIYGNDADGVDWDYSAGFSTTVGQGRNFVFNVLKLCWQFDGKPYVPPPPPVDASLTICYRACADHIRKNTNEIVDLSLRVADFVRKNDLTPTNNYCHPRAELTTFLFNGSEIEKSFGPVWHPSFPPGNGHFAPAQSLVPARRIDCWLLPEVREQFWASIVN